MSEDPYDYEPPYEQRSQQATPSSRVVCCTNCGIQLDGLRIGEPCPNCHAPVGSSAQTGSKSNGKSVAALVLGICSFVGCLLYGLPGIVCGVLAIVFGNKVRQGVADGEIHVSSLGMANAGRVCGIIGLCLSTLCMLAAAAWFVFFFSFMMPQQQQMNQQMMQQLQQQMQMQQSISTPAPAQPTPTPDLDEPETQTPPTTNP